MGQAMPISSWKISKGEASFEVVALDKADGRQSFLKPRT